MDIILKFYVTNPKNKNEKTEFGCKLEINQWNVEGVIIKDLEAKLYEWLLKQNSDILDYLAKISFETEEGKDGNTYVLAENFFEYDSDENMYIVNEAKTARTNQIARTIEEKCYALFNVGFFTIPVDQIVVSSMDEGYPYKIFQEIMSHIGEYPYKIFQEIKYHKGNTGEARSFIEQCETMGNAPYFKLTDSQLLCLKESKAWENLYLQSKVQNQKLSWEKFARAFPESSVPTLDKKNRIELLHEDRKSLPPAEEKTCYIKETMRGELLGHRNGIYLKPLAKILDDITFHYDKVKKKLTNGDLVTLNQENNCFFHYSPEEPKAFYDKNQGREVDFSRAIIVYATQGSKVAPELFYQWFTRPSDNDSKGLSYAQQTITLVELKKNNKHLGYAFEFPKPFFEHFINNSAPKEEIKIEEEKIEGEINQEQELICLPKKLFLHNLADSPQNKGLGFYPSTTHCTLYLDEQARQYTEINDDDNSYGEKSFQNFMAQLENYLKLDSNAQKKSPFYHKAQSLLSVLDCKFNEKLRKTFSNQQTLPPYNVLKEDDLRMPYKSLIAMEKGNLATEEQKSNNHRALY